MEGALRRVLYTPEGQPLKGAQTSARFQGNTGSPVLTSYAFMSGMGPQPTRRRVIAVRRVSLDKVARALAQWNPSRRMELAAARDG